MTMFQLIVLPVLGAFIVITGVAAGRRRIPFRTGLAWIALWAAAAVAIADPDLLVRAARIAGIARGVDLVLYVALLAGVAALFLVHLRFRRIDEQLTELVRHLAVTEALREREAGSQTSTTSVADQKS